jgi:hypothetical protein
LEEDVIVDLIRMMKLRNKTALPEKKKYPQTWRRFEMGAYSTEVVGTTATLPTWHMCYKKKVVIMSIPCSCMSEVLGSTDIFLTIRSKREKFYNTLLSCRIAITIKR